MNEITAPILDLSEGSSAPVIYINKFNFNLKHDSGYFVFEYS